MATAIDLKQQPTGHDPAEYRRIASAVDAQALERDLRAAVRGEVRFDRGSRALYATDGSNYRQPPIGVVIPLDGADVEAAMAVCRRHDAPVFGRGGGTSLAGQCCNTAVCFDLSKYMNRVLDIDPERKLGRVQPGTILDDLRRRAQQVGLTFAPDPATHTHCTLGGMTGNDSCGVQPVMAQFPGQGPRTADNVQELDVLTYAQLDALRRKYEHAIRTGFPKIPRRVSGYNLPYLLPESGFNIARALVGPDVFRQPTTSPRSWSTARSGSKDSTIVSWRT